MAISSAPKCNRHGIGYQPIGQKSNGRMGSRKKNRMVRSNLVFPPLKWTFRSGDYINSILFGEDEDIVTPLFTLTLNAIIENEETVESARLTVYPCPLDFELNN